MADVGKRMYWVTSSGVEFVEREWYSKCKIVYTCAHKEDIYCVYVCFHIYILREGERVRSGGFGSVKERERGALVEFLESKNDCCVCLYTHV